MILAASALVLALLQQIEEASFAEPPVFQVSTLLSATELLPPDRYPDERFGLIQSAVRANAAIRDPRSRYVFLTNAATLLAAQDREEARRFCREIPAEAASRCWSRVDPLEGLRAAVFPGREVLELVTANPELLGPLLAAFPDKPSKEQAHVLREAAKLAAPHNAALAAEALETLRRAAIAEDRTPPEKKKDIPVSAEIREKMDRADNEALPASEKSALYRAVLDASGSIDGLEDRLAHQGFIAAWFAGNGEESTAALAAAMLQKTFAEACRCEDAQCDSIEGRAGCSDNIDTFVEYLAEQKIDPAALRIRHPSLAARVLVRKLKEALE